MVMDPGFVPEEEPETEAAPSLAPEPVDYDAVEGGNLATVLPRDFLQRLSARVAEGAKRSYDSFEEWRKKTAQNLQLFNGDIPDAGSDQENITAMHLPYAKRAVRTFFSKLFPQLYPADGEMIELKVRSPWLQDPAARCTIHMNFQLFNKIPEYLPSHDRGMKQLLIEGSIYEIWWFDVIENRPCQEICLAEDFWISYTAKTDRPDMADVPIKTWVKSLPLHKLEAQEEAGYYIAITQPFEHVDGGSTPAIAPPESSYDEAGTAAEGSGALMDKRDQPVRDEADSNSGVEEQSNDPDADRKVLEQDRWVRLPGETKQRLLTICQDEATQTILSVRLCEIVDPVDNQRFKREMAARQQAIDTSLAIHEEETMRWQQSQIDPMTGGPAFDVMTGEPYDPGPPPGLPPEPPAPTPPKKRPWYRSTKYDCDTNPEGALGHGIVADISGHNILANKIATRGVSQMTLSMLPTIIASRQSRFTRGDQQLKLGKITESPLSPQQVQDGAGLFRLQMPPPDPNWYRVIELADKNCQEISAFDIASGAPGMSGETATESEMRHSNAVDNISAVGARVNRARAASLKNLAIINSMTLPDEGETIYYDAGDIDPATGEPIGAQPVVVTREDYEAILGELEVTFTCDPNFESKPLKEKRAAGLIQVIDNLVNKPVAGIPAMDPITGVKLSRDAACRYLKVIEAPKEWIAQIRSAPLPNLSPPPPPGAPTNGPQQGGPAGGANAGGAPPPGEQPGGQQGAPFAA